MKLVNLKFALRYLLKSRGGSITRTVSLTLGLAVGLLVFSYINFQLSFDTFFPSSERIYQMWATISLDGSEVTGCRLNAPIAPALAHDIPQVEAATRIVIGFKYDMFYNDIPYPIQFATVDSSFFDVLNLGVVSGNPREIFSRPDGMMVSQSLARTIFGEADPIGKVLRYQSRNMTVLGVFNDVPLNTHLGQLNALLPLKILEGQWDMSWTGGDSYTTYIKLKPNAKIDEVEAQLGSFFEKYGVKEQHEQWNMRFFFVPLAKSATTANSVMRTVYLLGAMGLLAVLVACMNYVLISISTMVNRSKTMAMLRCNGAQKHDILSTFLHETGIITLISLVLAALIIFSLKAQIHSITQYPIGELFAPSRIWVPLCVIVAIFLASGLIPAAMFARIPVTIAFRGQAQNKARWKHLLLFAQLVCVAFAITFLTTTMLQFNRLQNGDLGYSYKNLVYIMPMVNAKTLDTHEAELAALPEVEATGTSYGLPIFGYGGMPCYDEETRELLFSCRVEDITPGYIPTMGMTIVEGSNLTASSLPNDVIVNEDYVRRRGWKDSPIGHQIVDSDSPTATRYTIVGVVKDFKMGAKRGVVEPIVMHNLRAQMPSEESKQFRGGMRITIRLHQMSPSAIESVASAIKGYWSTDNYKVTVYSELFNTELAEIRSFRNVTIAVGIITLSIALIGLLGYLADETRRRTKEIGIRKVNGAGAGSILKLLTLKITAIAVASVLTGSGLAYIVAKRWLTMFDNRIPLSWWIFAGGSAVVIIVVYAVQLVKTWRTANAKPIDMLRNE